MTPMPTTGDLREAAALLRALDETNADRVDRDRALRLADALDLAAGCPDCAVPDDAPGRLEAADLAAIENVFRLFEVGGGLLTNRERDARAKVLAALAGAPEGADRG